MNFSKGPSVTTCFLAETIEGWLWHQRLGHVCMRNLQALVKKMHIIEIADVKFHKNRLFGACEASKLMKKLHSPDYHDHDKATQDSSHGPLRAAELL